MSTTHAAVVTASVRGPLQVIQMPTVKPVGDEVLVRVEYTASTPLDLHQNDGGLLVTHPQVLGSTLAGTILELGPEVKSLKKGDRVFGFTWRSQKERGQQQYATVPEYLLGVIPPNFSPQEAVTLPDNFVTVFHAVTADLGLPLPWPLSTSYKPRDSNVPILIWGGSSSVGQFALQILRYYGYSNLLTTSSKPHFAMLKAAGARECFDYRSYGVGSLIIAATGLEGPKYILDCIGSKSGSLEPLSRIAGPGSTIAVLLPVIMKDASVTEAPVYEMDATKAANWKKGVEVKGVRAHSYLDNPLFKEKLQPDILPTLLAKGIVKPNKYRLVEGATLLERAQKAIDALRNKEVSGERLVWRVAE